MRIYTRTDTGIKFCRTCNKKIVRGLHEGFVPWDGRIYCGHSCSGIGRRKLVEKVCKECGKTFSIHLCWDKRGGGVYCSRKCMHKSPILRLKKSVSKLSEKNPMWNGKEVGLAALHECVLRRKPKPTSCEKCKESPSRDLANISQMYYRSVKDFQWLCRKCHMESDGRLNNLKKPTEKEKELNTKCFICGKEYHRSPIYIKRKVKINCSRKCAGIMLSKRGHCRKNF